MSAVVLFVTSAYFSYMELKYAAFGHTAEATVRQVGKIIVGERRYSIEEHWLAEFVYTDAQGKVQVEQEDMGNTSNPPPAVGQKLEIEYLSGGLDTARLKGQRNYVAISIFFLATGILTFFIVKLAREAAAYGRENRARRARDAGRRPYRF